MMYFDFNPVDGYVLVHAGFKADRIAARVELCDGFACTSIVFLSYIQVDVPAHSAFGIAIVLCYALPFEED